MRSRFDVFILAGAVLISSISYYLGMIAIPQELGTEGILVISIGVLAGCILLAWWVETRRMHDAIGYELYRGDAVIIIGAVTTLASILLVLAGIHPPGMDPEVPFLFVIPFFAALIILVAAIELVLKLMKLDQLDEDIAPLIPLIEPHVSKTLNGNQKQMIWFYKHRKRVKRFGRAFVIAGILAQLAMTLLLVMGVSLSYLTTPLSFLIVLEGCISLAGVYAAEHPETDGRIGWVLLVVLCSLVALLLYVEPIYVMDSISEEILYSFLYDLTALIIATLFFQAFFRKDAEILVPLAPQIA